MKDILKKLKEMTNKLLVISLIGLVLLGAIIASVIFLVSPSMKSLSIDEAGEVAMKFINEEILAGQGITAELLDIKSNKAAGCYEITIDVDGYEYVSYISKDGTILYPEGYAIEELSSSVPEEETPVEIPQTEVPDVKLFIMSYCPYGLQSQKALLPSYNLLGDKADIGIYFVSYLMHDKAELDENLTQYCIQEEQEDKYYAYLSCFVESGDSDSCLLSTSVDTASLNSCVIQTDAEYSVTETFNSAEEGSYPSFNVNLDLNNQYAVEASPTLIINGVEANPSRSPEGYKEAICSAFTEAPEECSTVLSDEVASYSFGSDSSATNSNGSCE